MKIHTEIRKSYLKVLRRFGWVLLVPALATSLPAQTGPELNIERVGDGSCVLTWLVSTDENVVLSTTNLLTGPWKPRLESVSEAVGMQHMTVTAPHQIEYFKLAKGQRFEDDFNDGDLEGWSDAYDDPQFESIVTLAFTNGQLRIHGTCAACTSRFVLLYRTNLVMADFAMSIDILGWDERPGDHPNVALVARVDESFVSTSNVYAYDGAVSMESGTHPGRSALYFIEFAGAATSYIGSGPHPFDKTSTSKDYRLVFYGVGSQLTVQLYDLADGALVTQHQATDGTLTEGWIGFLVGENGPSGTVDFYLDDFVAVGTTP